MARGAEGKLRRRNRKKADADQVTDMFGTGDHNDDNSDDDGQQVFYRAGGAVIEDDDDDDSPTQVKQDDMPKKKKKGSSSKSKPTTTPEIPNGKKSGIKTLPLVLLILLVGTTVLPALIYAGDYASAFLAKSNLLGSLGFRMGIGAVPKKRVVSFYEKHSPEKLGDVPSILAKHYGDYPKLIKKLERKYQDYGYFVGWQEDESPMRIAMEKLQATYDTWLQQYWNRYAPQVLKTAIRNVRYNLTFLYKKLTKVWKKQVWPVLEPLFGVPDAKAAAAQKRKDAAEARARAPKKKSAAGTRRRNTEFRDEDDE